MRICACAGKDSVLFPPVCLSLCLCPAHWSRASNPEATSGAPLGVAGCFCGWRELFTHTHTHTFTHTHIHIHLLSRSLSLSLSLSLSISLSLYLSLSLSLSLTHTHTPYPPKYLSAVLTECHRPCQIILPKLLRAEGSRRSSISRRWQRATCSKPSKSIRPKRTHLCIHTCIAYIYT